MNHDEYTKEQIKDINERVEKAKIALKELNLEPRCIMSAVNTGDDVFALKATVYLQDIAYQPAISPIQQSDLK